jgi:hypothetical protein
MAASCSASALHANHCALAHPNTTCRPLLQLADAVGGLAARLARVGPGSPAIELPAPRQYANWAFTWLAQLSDTVGVATSLLLYVLPHCAGATQQRRCLESAAILLPAGAACHRLAPRRASLAAIQWAGSAAEPMCDAYDCCFSRQLALVVAACGRVAALGREEASAAVVTCPLQPGVLVTWLWQVVEEYEDIQSRIGGWCWPGLWGCMRACRATVKCRGSCDS